MAKAVGMFISEYQLSFNNLGNLDYIFQRAQDGLVTDDEFYAMLPQVQTIECRGAVHNFRPEKDWKQQADRFLSLVDGKGFKILCGDYESGVLNKQAAIDFWCFLNYLKEQRPAIKVIFYTGLYKLRDYLNVYNGVSTQYGIINWELFDYWIAQYPVSTDANGITTLLKDPQTSSPYLSIPPIGGVVVRKTLQKFWQYWADGNKQGAKYGCGSRDTNCDVFSGTIAELRTYFNINVVPPVVPPVENPECCNELDVRLVVLEGRQDPTAKITELDAKYSTLHGELDTITNKITGVKTDLALVKTTADSTHTALGNTRIELEELERKNADLTSKINQLERAVGEFATEMSFLSGEVEKIIDNIEVYKTEVDDKFDKVWTSVKNNTIQIATMKIRLSAIAWITNLFKK